MVTPGEPMEPSWTLTSIRASANWQAAIFLSSRPGAQTHPMTKMAGFSAEKGGTYVRV